MSQTDEDNSADTRFALEDFRVAVEDALAEKDARIAILEAENAKVKAANMEMSLASNTLEDERVDYMNKEDESKDRITVLER